MTADVRIRRCTATIRRRSGWSWGSGAEPHVTAALTGIEEAVEAAIAEAGLPADTDVYVAEPLRLDVGSDGVATASSRDALVELLRASMRVPPYGAAPGASRGARDAAHGPAAATAFPKPADDAGGDVSRARAIDAPIDSAAARPPAPGPRAEPHVAGAAQARAGTSSEGGWTAPVGSLGGVPALDGEPPVDAIARILARWSRGGQLARITRAWPDAVMRDWLAAIAAAAAAQGSHEPPAAMSAAAIGRIAEALFAPPPPDEASGDAERRLVVLLGAIAVALGDRLPDAETQLLARRAAGAGDVPAGRGGQHAARRPPSREPAPAGDPAAAIGELVVPALPLLVLAQLSRIGYVDAIASAAAVAGLPRAAGALGAVVAAKALLEPAPGDTAGDAVLALVSGGPPELLPGAFAAIAEHADALLASLAAALHAAYAEGRSASDELLVSAGEHGVLCGEPEGLLPAAWVDGEAQLDGALAALGRPLVRRDDAFMPFARALDARRILPCAHALERHLAAAAGTGLGLIALGLWGASGRDTTPLLALERLGDLEARVSLDADGLHAAVPRGQRWLDLQRGGLLELFEIPWLPRGRLEIGTW